MLTARDGILIVNNNNKKRLDLGHIQLAYRRFQIKSGDKQWYYGGAAISK